MNDGHAALVQELADADTVERAFEVNVDDGKIGRGALGDLLVDDLDEPGEQYYDGHDGGDGSEDAWELTHNGR